MMFQQEGLVRKNGKDVLVRRNDVPVDSRLAQRPGAKSRVYEKRSSRTMEQNYSEKEQ